MRLCGGLWERLKNRAYNSMRHTVHPGYNDASFQAEGIVKTGLSLSLDLRYLLPKYIWIDACFCAAAFLYLLPKYI